VQEHARARRRPPSASISGYAVGGLSVGEPRALCDEIASRSADERPGDRPRT